MALTREQVKALLALPEKKRGGNRKPKNFIDTSVRDFETWFKLAHKMYDEETNMKAECSNPNCTDTRSVKMIATVNGKDMCRTCFLDEYSMVAEGQIDLDALLGDKDK